MTVALKIHTRDISAVITSRVLTRRHFGPRCGSKIRTPLLSGSGLIVISSIIGWNIYLPAMSRMLRSFAASSSSPTLTAAASSSPGCWPYTIWTQEKCSWRCSNRIETKLKLQPSTEQFRPVHCLISPPIGSGQLVSVDLLIAVVADPQWIEGTVLSSHISWRVSQHLAAVEINYRTRHPFYLYYQWNIRIWRKTCINRDQRDLWQLC